MEVHNFKAIERMNSYLKRLFFSYWSIYKTFLEMQDDILKLQNELNFKKVDNQTIESYNKMVEFMYIQILSILSQKLSGPNFCENLIIQPVNKNKQQYSHQLEIVYFLSNSTSVTKQIGNISNISIVKINDHVQLLRSTNSYSFTYIDYSTSITIDYFIDHLKKYSEQVKELLGWLYNDIEYTKSAFRMLLDVMSDAVKLSNSTEKQEKWRCLLKKIKFNINTLCESMSEIEKCQDCFDDTSSKSNINENDCKKCNCYKCVSNYSK